MKKLGFVTLFASMLFFAPQIVGSTIPTSANASTLCPPPPAVVASFLGLTPGQVEQFGIILSRVLPVLQGLQQQGTAVQQQLEVLLSQPNPDPAQVGKLMLQLHVIQQQSSQVINDFHNAFRGLLSQDQIQKAEAVSVASQLQPVLGSFVALYLVPPPLSTPCQNQ